jgi:hypothetical protein
MDMKQKLMIAAALGAALISTACGSVKIARINADPSHYSNRTVRVDGRVVTSAGLLGHGLYQIEDNTGRIYVISSTGVPSRGARVKVTGSVISGAQILGTSVGTAIREEHHSVR